VSDSVLERAIESAVRFGRTAAGHGLVVATSGNVSLRVDDERLVVSASGSELAELGPGDVSVLALDDGALLHGPRPSIESTMHRAVYRARPEAAALIHGQSPAATLLACCDAPPRDLGFTPEIPAYIREHAYVPYARPGSEALAESVARAFKDPDVTVVQMGNHGQMVAASEWRRAVWRAVFFERACRMALSQLPLRTIPDEELTALRSYGWKR
jgi:ribulose-5-phosphate 4-epimerase/fuculose-1-phosphate aldolase